MSLAIDHSSDASTLKISAVDPLIETLEISEITRDVVVRAKGTNRVTVSDYAAAMASGSEFPPIVVYRDPRGVLHLSDGAHRLEATLRNGGTTIAAEIRTGSKKDCLAYAVGSGRQFGLRFSTADKRRAIEMMLAAFPKMSNLKLSQLIGVDDKTVGATKARLASSEIPTPDSGDGSEIPTPPDPVDVAVGKLKTIISKVPEAERARFAEMVLALLTAPETAPE